MTLPKKPDMDQLIRFIHATHDCEKLKCPVEEIRAAMKNPPRINPFAKGHFSAINYLMTLVRTPDVPCKDNTLLTNVYRSDEALFWLRTLHEKITFPLSQAHDDHEYEEQCANVKQWECGVYRNVPVMLAYKPAPPPHLIPNLLHVWLKKVSALHDSVKDLVDNPYGLTKEKAFDLTEAAHETTLLFANIHPFQTANNRLGRLVENLFRLNWLMPWKDVPRGRDYEDFFREIEVFGDVKLPHILKEAESLGEF